MMLTKDVNTGSMKRIISIMLVLSMILTGNGIFTFASSIENLIKEDETRSSEPKNYYEMSYYEEYSTISGDEEFVDEDEESIGADEETVDADEESIGTDEESTGTDEESTGTGEESVVANDETVVANETTVGSNDETVGANDETIGANDETVGANETTVGANACGALIWVNTPTNLKNAVKSQFF